VESSESRSVVEWHSQRMRPSIMNIFCNSLSFKSSALVLYFVGAVMRAARRLPPSYTRPRYRPRRNRLRSHTRHSVKNSPRCSRGNLELLAEFFERLGRRCLSANGIRRLTAEAGEAIGKTGDEGIDGIIKEDRWDWTRSICRRNDGRPLSEDQRFKSLQERYKVHGRAKGS